MSCSPSQSRNWIRRQLRLAVVLAVAIFPHAQQSGVAEEATQPLAKPLSFRRVFVPASAPESWPIGNQRYLPLREAEFERLLKQAGAASRNESLAAVRLSYAVYHAELQNDGLLIGKGEQQVELLGERPRLLSLEPMGAAMGSAHWQRTPAEPAWVGSWHRASRPSPGLAVLVERSGTLVFDWQQGPHATGPARYEYRLAFPPAVPTKIELALPPDYTPSVDRGIFAASSPHPDGTRRWSASLAPGGTTQLTIERKLPAQASAPLPRASLSTDYRLDSNGLEFEIAVSLDSRMAATESLRFTLTGSARITAASVNDKPAPWHLREGSEGEFVVPLAGQASEELQVVLRGVAPLQTEILWHLPTLQPLDVFWTSGTASLFVSPSLQLLILEPEDASLQHIVGINEDHQNGEAYRLQQWTKQAALGVIVARREQHAESRLIHVLNVGGPETMGRTLASLSTTGPAIFQIEAEVAPHWEIDSIEIDPALALGSWRIDRSRDQAVVQIQLHRPLQANQPLRVQIDGRWTSPQPLLPSTLGQIPLVKFLDVATPRQLLVLQSSTEGPVELSTELERARIDLGQFDPPESDVLASLGEGPVIEITHLPASTPVDVLPLPARYEANVFGDVRVLPESFQHRFRFEVQPKRGAVAEIVIEFRNPLPEPVLWNLVGQEHAVAVDVVSTPESSTVTGSSGVTYRVRLPAAQAEPFEIEAHFETKQPDTAQCEALTLPEAERWQGWFTIHGPMRGVLVESHGCLPVGLAASSEIFGRPLPLLGRYRMDSSLSLQRQRTPQVRREIAAQQQDAEEVFAWFADYTTILDPSGTSVFVASYSLDNSAARDVEICLPQGATLQTAWQNRTQVQPSPVAGTDQTYRFHFSNHGRYSSLTVRYTTKDSAPGVPLALASSMPTCPFDVRRGKWTVWTSQQYALREMGSAETSERMGWFARLFGPLARNSSQHIFRPFAARDWQALWSTPLETRHSRLSAQRLEKKLASQAAAHPQQPWSGALLEVLAELDLRETVLVDQIALASQGIEAETPTGTAAEELRLQLKDSGSSGVLLSGAALVASPGTIVLTTTDRIAQWRDQLHRRGDSRVYRTKLGPLATRLSRLEGTPSGEIVPVRVWEVASGLHRASWSQPSAPSLAATGWRATTFEFVGSEPTVAVYLVAARRALHSAAWLLATVLGACWFGRRPGWLIVIAASSAALSLMVSPEAVALPQAIFLGTLTAVGLRTFWQVLAQNRAFRLPRSPRPLVTLLLLFALFAAQSNSLYAQDARLPNAASLRTVFYPIDALGQLQGEDVFVSEDFLSELSESSRHSAYDGATCVLLQAKLRGSLPPAVSNPAASASPWSLSLVVKSFVAGSRWSVSLHREDADWLEGEHLLDGVPVRLQWDKKGQSCEFLFAESGTHRLELRFVPRIVLASPTATLNFHIPPLSGVLLDLEVPPAIEDLQVASAGPLKAGDPPLHLQTKLAATNQLQLAWKVPTESEKQQLVGSVEQMSWLHITPAAARLEVRFRIRSEDAPPHSLLLNKPPHLKLLPLAEDSPVESWQPVPGNASAILLHLKPALGNQFDFLLPFQLDRASAVGTLDYPEVRLQGVAPTRNWFAVSVSAGLSYVAQDSASFRPIVSKEFALQWPDSEAQPLFAYSVGSLSRDWSMRVWPDPSSMIVQQSIQVEAHPEGVNLSYEAIVDNLAGSWLIHRLKVPRALRVETVSISAGSTDDTIPTRWVRNSEEEIVIFCGRPIREPHTIRLRGRVDLAEDRTVPLPTIWLRSATADDALRLDLIRRPEVLVARKNPQHKLPKTPREGFLRHDTHLLVDRYLLHESMNAEKERLEISQNQPSIEADSMVTLDQHASELTATLAARVSVREGVVGRLQISAPATWHEPWSVFPVGSGVIGRLQKGSDGNTLVVRLTKPLHAGETIDLRISGTLAPPSSQRLKVPDLRFTHAETKRRFVLLPSKLAGRAIAWRVEGLKHEKIPGDLVGLLEGVEHKLPFRVIADRFTVREQTRENQLRHASLRHMAVRGVVDGDGVWTGTAEILLQPGMATHCALQLPPNSQMIQIWVGDQRVQHERIVAESDEPARWQISLGPLYLPQRITVSYTSRPSIAGGRITLVPPQVLIGNQALPTPLTSWQILPVGEAVPGEVQQGQSISSEAFSRGVILARWNALTNACPAAMRLPAQESLPWFLAWQRHLRQTSEEWEIARMLQLVEERDADEKFREAWDALARHLGEENTAEVPRALVPPQSLAGTPPAINRRELFLQSNATGHLQLQWGRPAWHGVAQTLLAMLLVGGGILMAWQSIRASRWTERLSRRPHLTAIVLGLFWWLLLHPSLLGLLVVVVACIDWLQQQATTRKTPNPAGPSGISHLSTSLAKEVT